MSIPTAGQTGKRSRTGCSVCLTRKRKCDEDWREDGSCQRCFKSGLECIRLPSRSSAETSRVLPKIRYLSSSKPPIQSTNPRAPSTSHTSNPIPSTSNTLPDSNNPLPLAPTTHPQPSFTPPQNEVPPTTAIPNTQASSSSLDYDPFLPPLVAYDFPIPLPSPILFEFPYAPTNVVSTTSSIPPTAAPLSEPSGFPPPAAAAAAAHQPWAFAEQTDVSEYGVLANSAVNSVRVGIEMSLGMSPVGASGSSARFGGAAAGEGEDTVIAVDGVEDDGPEHEVYKLYASINPFRDPLYISLTDVFFRSFPQKKRREIYEYFDSYMSQHETARSAALAISLLYYARNQLNGSPKQKRLLVHSRSMLFRALDLLHRTPSLPLDVVLCSTTDLAYCQIESIGGAGVQGLMMIAGLFVKSRLGDDYTLDFELVLSSHQFLLLMFAYYDILHTIVMPFPHLVITSYKGMPGSRSPLVPTPEYETWLKNIASSPLTVHQGLPVALALCFAGISTLASEMMNGLDLGETMRRAGEIAQAIRSWKAEIHYDNDEELGSYKAIVEATTQEMWRQAALIYLHYSIHRMGCMAQALRNPALQIIQLGTITYSPPNGEQDLHLAMSHRACPWFLAATCAISPQEREQCRTGLKMCGTHRGFRETLEAAEFIWARVDREGHTFDWRTALVDAHLYPCFI
ncbi:hypothetical protein T439DRAFT_329119 [Meredithblackwellia eburnea MCA 4105]